MSWLKIDTITPDKPEVWAMSELLGLDRDAVFGKLFRVWVWFDEHTRNGNAAYVTTALIDNIAGVENFAKAMIEVRWLHAEKDGVSMPHFDRHNGKSAKKRALTARRVAQHKAGDRNTKGNAARAKGNAVGNAQANATGNAPPLADALPREEKIREEVNIKTKPKNIRTRAASFDAQAQLESLGVDPQVARDWLTLRAGKRLKPTETALTGVEREAKRANLSMDETLRLCCLRGWGGFEADWLLTRLRPSHGPPNGYVSPRDLRETRDCELIAAMTGRDPRRVPDDDVFDLPPEDVRHVDDRSP
ncbi:hypothetical protein [Paraburkholderia domus]|uniref:DUF1376 domain-containing protein n=1 Tax=Paraburkholderia domus TaxID=2793075 RepID=A0A9N8NCQ0_9BURK|nr:hypothetical protein [Paraburkholderia domus]MBK5162783.1 hypothetical protein [Burkholderia sp. R-70211]CAE6958933.1 hypothetical protein R70211_06793 [Paraburkholderia domus]